MKNKSKRIIKIILAAILAVAAILLAYVAYVFIAYYRVEDNVKLEVHQKAESKVNVDEELSILSYNIGFGAYSDDYSFFMDGGKESRARSPEAVYENIDGALNIIQDENPDFMLLQEVDLDGTRSHHIDQTTLVRDAFPKYSSVFAQNYDSPYLFWPLLEPHGANKAGTMTLSSYKIQSSLRRSLPIEEDFMKLVDLDRCYAINRIPTNDGHKFVLINFHLSAYTISKYWVYKDNHTIIRPGDNVNVAITIKNDGKDLAKDVKVDLQWPQGALGRDKMVTIPFLKPGETKDIMTSFVVDKAQVDSLSKEEFTIVAKLSEYTQKHNDIKYLSYHTGQMNAEINLEGGAAPIFQTQYASNTLAQNESRLVYEDAKAHQTGIGSVEQESELLNGISLTNQPDNNKYALVIGNEDYNSYKLGASYEVNVDHAVQDASVFAEYAKDYMGVPEENIILLRNATYAQMNFNLKKVMTMCQINKGQVELYIFYAGHGQHDVDSKETYLIPVDVSIAAPTSGIKLDDIYAGLSTCGAKRSMVFMDACYSGIGRGIVIKPKQAPVNGNVVVFTATSSSQRSMPYTEKKHGLFTYYLLKTIKEANGNINMIDLYENVKKEVVKNSIWINNSEQTPELINGEGIESGWKEWNIY